MTAQYPRIIITGSELDTINIVKTPEDYDLLANQNPNLIERTVADLDDDLIHDHGDSDEAIKDFARKCLNALYWKIEPTQNMTEQELSVYELLHCDVFVRSDSHRATDKLAKTLNRPYRAYSDYLFAGYRDAKGGRFFKVTQDEYQKLIKITGIKKPRIQEGYSRCISRQSFQDLVAV